MTIRPWGTSEYVTLPMVKQEYSKQVVLSQAKKYGWKLKEVAPQKWEVRR